MAGFFVCVGHFSNSVLEEFELLSWCVRLNLFLAHEEFYLGELLVGDGETSYLAKLRQRRLYTLQVYIGVLAAGAVAHVDGELEHSESVAQ